MSIKERGCQALISPLKRRKTCIRKSSSSLLRFATNAATSSRVSYSNDDTRDLSATGFSRPGKGAQIINDYDPTAMSRARKEELPSSRYQFRPPKYYRGPLHPHQPPPSSDPASREYIPGPFSLPRLEQTYHSTIASDLMTLSYQHHPPGFQPPPKAPRLREWDGSSPYHKNRPLRGPRGGDVLGLLKRRITFRNVPRLEGVVVHTFVKEALDDSGPLHVASMALQAITGAKVTPHTAKHNEVRWGLRAGKYVSLTVDLKGEEMYHFLSRLVDVVMPRIRDYKGVKGTSGDDNGNISLGLAPEHVALFPEVEVNYDAYPPRLIPGCHVTIKTSATQDRDARLLLTALGIPFYGKFTN